MPVDEVLMFGYNKRKGRTETILIRKVIMTMNVCDHCNETLIIVNKRFNLQKFTIEFSCLNCKQKIFS